MSSQHARLTHERVGAEVCHRPKAPTRPLRAGIDVPARPSLAGSHEGRLDEAHPRKTSSPRPRSSIKGNQSLAALTQDSRNAGSPSDGQEPDGQEPDGQEPDGQEPDVVLDVPELEVDRITLEVRDLRAHVSILAELANLVNIPVGVDARLDKVKLEIEGVEAEVHLVARLKNVRAILAQSMTPFVKPSEVSRSRIFARKSDQANHIRAANDHQPP